MISDIFFYMDSSPPLLAERGPLAGKTIAIQSNLSVHGWPTNAGSIALERFVALEDASIIERVKKAGAVIKGSTYMSELGLGLAGDTGASALTENWVDMVMMTDTMGEPRVSASTMGVYGFKPSYGIVSRYGLIGLIPSMEGIGILAKSPEEIASLMETIVGRDDRDFSMPECEMPNFSQVHTPRDTMATLGVVPECVKTLETDESEAFNEALSTIKKAHFKIREVHIADFDLFRTVHNVIGAVEASSSSGKYDGVRYGHRTASAKNWNEMYIKSRAESFGLLIKTYLFQGAYYQFENYNAFVNACRIRRRLKEEVNELYKNVDALVFPARRQNMNASKASTIGEVYDAFALTLLANVAGQPSVVIPKFIINGKTDLGLQLVGPWLNDAQLLSIAAGLAHYIEGVK